MKILNKNKKSPISEIKQQEINKSQNKAIKPILGPQNKFVNKH